MIKAIGLGKSFFILVLFAVAGFLYFYTHYNLISSNNDLERKLSSSRSQLAEIQQKTLRLKDGFEFFTKEKDKYDYLSQISFFNVQGRYEADQRLKVILEASNVLPSSQYSLKRAKVEEFEKLSGAGYQILNSELEINLGAVQDQYIYDYLFFLMNGFPGHITIDRLEIKRLENVTQPILRKIGTDKNNALMVSAQIDAEWRTAVQLSEADLAQQGQEENF